MLENAIYSVISPEGCASILFRDAKKAETATQSLKITAPDVIKLGVADGVVPEPLGGALNNWEESASMMKKTIQSSIKTLKKKTTETLLADRFDKFRLSHQYGKIVRFCIQNTSPTLHRFRELDTRSLNLNLHL